jgi:hypothetical protein
MAPTSDVGMIVERMVSAFDKDISKTKAIIGKHSREEDCEVAELRLPDIFCMNSGDTRPVTNTAGDSANNVEAV